MEVCCSSRVGPVWVHDGQGVVVWTDKLCPGCARRWRQHFWLMWLNQRWN